MKITKAQSKEFVQKVCAMLEDMGAVRTKGLIEDWIVYDLQTVVGKLTIHVDEDNNYCYSVFSRFEDVKKAKELFNCNPFSGKYNTHLAYNKVEDALEEVRQHFEITLKEETV